MTNKNTMDLQEQSTYFNQQHKYVNDNIKSIMEIYGGKFVMVYDSRIVDSDSDEFELGKRHHLRHQFDFTLPALITKIPKTLEEHLEEVKKRDEPEHLESPECAD